MKKLLLIFLLIAVGAYLWEKNYPQDMGEKVTARVKEMDIYHSVLNQLDRYIEKPAEDKVHTGDAPDEPAERRPYIDFQGVMQENGTLYAMVNNVLYKENDFIRDYRVVEVGRNYIVIQGRTRQFRYSLN